MPYQVRNFENGPWLDDLLHYDNQDMILMSSECPQWDNTSVSTIRHMSSKDKTAVTDYLKSKHILLFVFAVTTPSVCSTGLNCVVSYAQDNMVCI